MPDRHFRLYLQDISDSGNAILDYVRDMSFTMFQQDRKTAAAVVREFEIIGEAVGKLPESVKMLHPEIAWQDIKDFRNLLLHEYFGIDLEIVWNVINDDLAKLLAAVKKMS